VATRKTAIRIAEDFAKDVRNSGVELKKVILFGSFAKNKQRSYSDIDIALVSDKFIGVGFEDIKLFVKALHKHVNIQPKTFPTNYFKKGDPFIEEITKTGIEIHF